MAKPSKPCEYLNKEQLESVLSGSYERVIAEVYDAFGSGDVLGVFPGYLIAVVEGSVVRFPWTREKGDIVFGASESSDVECRAFWSLVREGIEASLRYAKSTMTGDTDGSDQALQDMVDLAEGGIPMTGEAILEVARRKFVKPSWWREHLEKFQVEYVSSKGDTLIDRIIALDFAAPPASESEGDVDLRRFVGEAEDAAEDALLAVEAIEMVGVDLFDDLVKFVEDLEKAAAISHQIVR